MDERMNEIKMQGVTSGRLRSPSREQGRLVRVHAELCDPTDKAITFRLFRPKSRAERPSSFIEIAAMIRDPFIGPTMTIIADAGEEIGWDTVPPTPMSVRMKTNMVPVGKSEPAAKTPGERLFHALAYELANQDTVPWPFVTWGALGPLRDCYEAAAKELGVEMPQRAEGAYWVRPVDPNRLPRTQIAMWSNQTGWWLTGDDNAKPREEYEVLAGPLEVPR